MTTVHLALLTLLCLSFRATNRVSSSPVLERSEASLSRPAEELENEVEQLNQLRREHEQHGGMAVVKSEKSEIITVNGQQKGKQEKQQLVKDLDKNEMLASVKQSTSLSKESSDDGPHTFRKTEVEIPPLGVHRVELEKDGHPASGSQLQNTEDVAEKKHIVDWNLDRPRAVNYYTKFAGIQYTPLDLAEYIYRTGDEEGVASAIEELLREGMMSREEAISYLQDVKTELLIMRDKYDRTRRTRPGTMDTQDLRSNQKLRSPEKSTPIEDQKGSASDKPASVASSKSTKETTSSDLEVRVPSSPFSTPPSTAASTSQSTKSPEPSPTSATAVIPAVDVGKQHEVEPSLPAPMQEKKSYLYGGAGYRGLRLPPEEQPQDDVDVAAILERLKAASSLYEEYTLEDIIYQLAKDMFTQSVLRGDQSAEEALTKFGNFLEAEVASNRISRELEQKILDIMSTALVDSLKEFPGVLPVEQAYPGNDPNALFQQLSLGKAEKINDYPTIEREREQHRHMEADRRLLLPKLMQHKKSNGGNGHLSASSEGNPSVSARQQS